MDDIKELNLTLDLCLRIGEVLLASGAGAADVTATMDSVARHLGLRHAEIDLTFTSLSMSYSYDDRSPPLSLIRGVKSRTIDYGGLTQVDQLVHDILDDQLDVYLARNRMAVLTSLGHPIPRWAVTLAQGGMAAAVAFLLGGGLAVVASALLAAMTIDRLQRWLTVRRLPTFYRQVAGGIVATLFAVAVAATGLDADPSLVVTANIVMLLAGIGFMGALQDGLTGFYLTSVARVLEAILATAGIIAGVSGGLSVSELVGLDIGRVEPAATGLATFGVFVAGSAVAAAAFAFASYAPNRSLLPIAVLAGAGAGVHRLLEEAGFGRTWAAGVAAFGIGFLSYSIASKVKVPPLVIVVPAIVPLLPGLLIYRGLSLLAGDGASVSLGLLAMITAASVAIALASGVILGEYVAQPLRREARRMEGRLAGPRLVGPLRGRTRRSKGT